MTSYAFRNKIRSFSQERKRSYKINVPDVHSQMSMSMRYQNSLCEEPRETYRPWKQPTNHKLELKSFEHGEVQ